MDTELARVKHHGIEINSVEKLGAESLSKLERAFATPPPISGVTLGGRREVQRLELSEVGEVVVKHYARGGLLGRVISTWHLRFTRASRASREFEMLLRVRALGINTPKPIAYAARGGTIYKNWLVTAEVSKATTLGQLALKSEDQAKIAIEALIEQIFKLIENGVFHIDLHPGNVLVTETSQVYLLDFDKASDFKGSRDSLRDLYLHRWRRATLKHALPDFLIESVSLALRRRFG